MPSNRRVHQNLRNWKTNKRNWQTTPLPRSEYWRSRWNISRRNRRNGKAWSRQELRKPVDPDRFAVPRAKLKAVLKKEAQWTTWKVRSLIPTAYPADVVNIGKSSAAMRCSSCGEFELVSRKALSVTCGSCIVLQCGDVSKKRSGMIPKYIARNAKKRKRWLKRQQGKLERLLAKRGGKKRAKVELVDDKKARAREYMRNYYRKRKAEKHGAIT